MTPRHLRTAYRRGEYPGDLGELAREPSWAARRSPSWTTWAGWIAVPAAAALLMVIGVGWWMTPDSTSEPTASTPSVRPTTVATAEPTTTAIEPRARGPRPRFTVPDRPVLRQRPLATRGLSAPPTSSLTRMQRLRFASLSPSSFPSIPSFPSPRSATDAAAPSS